MSRQYLYSQKHITYWQNLAFEGVWVFFSFCFKKKSFPTIYFIMAHSVLLFSAQAVQDFDYHKKLF